VDCAAWSKITSWSRSWCVAAIFEFPSPIDFELRLTGRTVLRLERRAKYILGFLDSEDVLIAHLGMSGRLFGYRPDDPKRPTAAEKHDHVWLHTDRGTLVCYNDPRRFGLMTLASVALLHEHPLLKALGIEPLSDALTPQFVRNALRTRHVPIKVALLDQSIIVGIGNIYASEILHRAHIAPQRPASGLGSEELKALCTSIPAILRKAINAGGSTLRDYVQADGELGGFQNSVRRVRSRRATMSTERLSWHDRSHRPSRPRHLFLHELPALTMDDTTLPVRLGSYPQCSTWNIARDSESSCSTWNI
jgi:formamidopyrimidine-DNA glycosylase